MEEESDQMDEDDDLALDDETLEDSMTTQKAKPAINQSGAKGNNIPVAPEDSVAPADRAETEAESAAGDVDMTPSFPSHLDVRVSKAGKGALQFNVIAQNGMVEIDEVFYFPDVELAESDSAEKLSKRNRLYSGPPYNNLDQDLQQMLERYLDERGINVQLATFVPDYIDFKEQREYLKWLESMFIPPVIRHVIIADCYLHRYEELCGCLIQMLNLIIGSFTIHHARQSSILS